MNLAELLARGEYKISQRSYLPERFEIRNIVYDSRNVQEGDLFVCIRGAKSDGHDYIMDVCKKGAYAIIAEREAVVPKEVTFILVPDARIALAMVSAAYFQYPAEKLTTIGITGTKGKSISAYMIREILQYAGIQTGLIGTIETIIGNEVISSENTTPQSYVIQEYLARMVKAGCRCVVMEVSSQGIMQKRTAGFTFDYGVFTNIAPDHISPDEHKDFEEYLSCKASLFQKCRTGILNIDDGHINDILRHHTCSVEFFGTKPEAGLRALHIRLFYENGRMGCAFRMEGSYSMDVVLHIPGRFNVYNALTAAAVCRHFHISEDIVKAALLSVKVKGRVEPLAVSDRFSMMIDYAHNAMSMESLLLTIREYQPKRLICLFGCGGDRAVDRRFQMGEISSRNADLTVITSDNPRTEEPDKIIADILTGVKKAEGAYIAIPDRKAAIRYCIKNAKAGDVILLIGKGHETYQEINGIKYPMDERELVAEITDELKGRGEWPEFQ